MARSAAIVQAVGYQLVPISRPIGPWAILAVCGQGLLLVGVVKDGWPSTMGAVWGHRRLAREYAPPDPPLDRQAPS